MGFAFGVFIEWLALLFLRRAGKVTKSNNLLPLSIYNDLVVTMVIGTSEEKKEKVRVGTRIIKQLSLEEAEKLVEGGKPVESDR